MSALTKRTTVYLEPSLHKALHLQAIATSRSVSELINEAVRDELAQDARDLATFDEREAEPTIEFEDFVKGLKRDGVL
ncbi:MAG: CopG family transcriptional regulator [Candidatus Sumerlaeota bacterium]